MKPKEKAEQLINKYNLIVLDTALGGSNQRVKQCALITVDEIINAINSFRQIDKTSVAIFYWQEVKQEIENL